ncbi:CheA signal transduction histidine kinase [Hyella patelloides LEGE 07179]|uniref:histidine kinase n=1 Tax=Hyella patelloides LEGE 07179 TaxID=945734 RepID=A0A563VPM8_9CYAN|nr:hybrid sensor histidine kinase/response regulator [Hyella patelloides]VEP13416.1 CheA signal transduction histidine kinase [Hyella patelloides LEGE 07179]
MTNEQDIRNQVYQCFLTEASSLLPALEQDLLSVLEEPSIDKIHNLMRNAHTFKGSAASAERETIRTVAHHLEDVFKALYSPNINWDEELSALLWECYECLRESVTAEIAQSFERSQYQPKHTDSTLEETEILNRVAVVFAKLQTKLGDFFDREAPLPTSEELGFDVVGSIFAESMQQELQQLAAILATENSEQVAITLSSEAEFFIGIAESYNLPGMKELAQTILTALKQHPNQAILIAKLALEDLQKARTAVLDGDRYRGGEPSIALRELAAQGSSSSSSSSLTHLDRLVKATNSKLFLEPETPEDTSESESEVSLEPVPVEPNYQQLGTTVSPQEQQAPDTVSSRQLNAGDAIDQILQKIGLDRQESEVSEDSDFSHQSDREQKTTPPKSDFSSQSSGKEVRVDLLQLKRLNSIFGELTIAQNQQTLQTNQSQENTQKTLKQLQRCQQGLNLIRDWSDKYCSAQREKLPHSQASEGASPSLIGERFDSLEMDAYSEMHILIQSVRSTMVQLQSNIEEVDFSVRQSQLMLKKKGKLLADAQDNLLQARMLPLGLLLKRFPPIIKQLATVNRKPAQLELIGTHILIDKSIAENLFDPLLHLVRNAIAHGIESPEMRRQRGKSETGSIRIHAYHQGNRTIIEVADDGQGLNWERIRVSGVEQQLLDPDRAEIASERELAELLFEPGFSTTEQITELSGRGVGLDVVRSQIQRLQGSVTVSSVAGEGTVFSLHLPLVLITAKMLVCQSNGLSYALLTESIERVLQPEPDRISSQTIIQGHPHQKFLLWGEGKERQQVPIRTLASLLAYSFPTDSFSDSIPTQRQKIAPLVMLQQQDQLLCLEVEQIVTKQEFAIKSLGKKPTLPSYIQGYSVLSNSRLVMVLDPLELVNQTWSQFNSSRQARILPESITVSTSPLNWSAEIEQSSLPTSNSSSDRLLSPSGSLNSTLALQGQSILIVDDSPTQRKLLVLMLEKAGCSVLQAEDGQEALTQLRQHSEIKIIICDIEMPKVNGFEFLHAYHQDANLSPVDTIVLTSRSSLKHRQMAFELGARAYLTKPYSEQKLLSLLSDLISQKTANISVS